MIFELKTRIISLTQKFHLNPAVDELSYHLAFLEEAKLYCGDTHNCLSVQHLQVNPLKQVQINRHRADGGIMITGNP